jgi:hypothetical protein
MSLIQFLPAPSTTPQPPVRDAKGLIVGGDALAAFNGEVDDLARVLFGATRFVTISEAARTMPQAYNAALEIVLRRKEFTQAWAPDEQKRIAEQAEQKARNEKFHEAARKQGEALREAERIDRITRDQAADFKPRSQTTQKGSPAYAIERARYIAELNETRASHNLSMLSV